MMRLFPIAAAIMISAAPVWAQEAQPVAIDIQKPDISPVEPFPEGFRSLFFNEAEHKALGDALARRAPEAPVAVASPEPLVADDAPPPRTLHLSGIVYAAPEDWSIWLNGRQVTPQRQLPELRDIRVSRDQVELQWYDEQTKTVVPVRLRPQQRFNLDTLDFMQGGAGTPPAAPRPESQSSPAEWDMDEMWQDEVMLWNLLDGDVP